MSTDTDIPEGLGLGGRQLWDDIANGNVTLDAVQAVQLLEACRAKDRLDKLDAILRGDASAWLDLYEVKGTGGSQVEVVVDKVLASANTTANLLKQLLAALRLPDGLSGKRPQRRGGGRGSYAPKGAGATVTPIADRYAAAGL